MFPPSITKGVDGPSETLSAAQVQRDAQEAVHGSTRSIAVSVRGLGVTLRQPDGSRRAILHGLDLEVPAGQFLAIVGKSGCGKTTLLNVLSGIIDPEHGSTTVLGGTPREARSKLGFMFARDALFPWRTARRNVEYGLELRGVKKPQRRALAREALQAVRLGHVEDHWVWQLSQGMRQRVALARTWALDPEIFLMDEPFAALDANTRIVVQTQFLNLWKKAGSRTVVFVTHDLGEAVALADRVILMAEGRIMADIEVPLTRPRLLHGISEDERFQRITKELRGILG